MKQQGTDFSMISFSASGLSAHIYLSVQIYIYMTAQR